MVTTFANRGADQKFFRRTLPEGFVPEAPFSHIKEENPMNQNQSFQAPHYQPLNVQPQSQSYGVQNQNWSNQLHQCQNIIQQLINQTQQASQMYQQMLQQEQQNATRLEEIAQREQKASQMIQNVLQGHHTAVQQMQQVAQICRQLEQSAHSFSQQAWSHQVQPSQHQPFGTASYGSMGSANRSFQ